MGILSQLRINTERCLSVLGLNYPFLSKQDKSSSQIRKQTNTKFSWIEDHFSESSKEKLGHISNVIPNIFDEYYLVYKKVGIIDNFPFEDYPENHDTIEQTNKRIKIQKEFGLFLNPKSEGLFREIGLKELSSFFGIPYDHYVLGNLKSTPAIVFLSAKSEIALKKSLTELANGELLNLFIEDDYEDRNNQYLREIDVDRYFELREGDEFDDCCHSYLFPDDLSWCFITSENYPMFFCFKKQFSYKLQDNFQLETFKIEYDKPHANIFLDPKIKYHI